MPAAWNWKKSRKEKHQFQSFYCSTCHQRRKCRLEKECCPCYWARLEKRHQQHRKENYTYHRNQQADGRLLNPQAPPNYYLFHGQFYPFTEFLVRCQAQIIKERKFYLDNCYCQLSPKTRTTDEYTNCESCGKELKAANNMRIIKNRNDPQFWGLKVAKKILCLVCLKKDYYWNLVKGKRRTLNKYLQREYV